MAITETTSREETMPLVKVRQAAQITLPAEARKQLRVKVGDYLEAEVREGTLVLKPVAMVDRETARRELMEIVERDKWIGSDPRPSPEEEEQFIFDEVAGARSEA
jgi:AbrB family looped-hinge helix DNA binding protein